MYTYFHTFLATYPLDLTKTRLQIQGEGARVAGGNAASVPHRGFIGTAAGIGKVVLITN